MIWKVLKSIASRFFKKGNFSSKRKCEVFGHIFYPIFDNGKCIIYECTNCLDIKINKILKLHGCKMECELKIVNYQILKELDISNEMLSKIINNKGYTFVNG